MTQFAGKYSRGGESLPEKHYATTYCYSYNSPSGKYGKVRVFFGGAIFFFFFFFFFFLLISMSDNSKCSAGCCC
jgi:hypothetical protein